MTNRDLSAIAEHVARGLHESTRRGYYLNPDGTPKLAFAHSDFARPWEHLPAILRHNRLEEVLPTVQLILEVIDAVDLDAVPAGGDRVPHPITQAVDAAFGQDAGALVMYQRALAAVLRVVGSVSVSRPTLEEVAQGYVVQATPDPANGVVEFAAVPRP